ncbi:MAG: hypothetical protein ABF624_07030 [Liquorilactobacillus ghanensis]|uniref:hypothetical protein n=1 Tax=Liquorilactobacillus ghanensis TaxID=399370 RepID=UPI0039ED7AF9
MFNNLVLNDLELTFTSAPCQPCEREVYLVEKVSFSQNQELIFEIMNRENIVSTVVLKLSNDYDSKMIFASLYGQLGIGTEINGQPAGKINLAELIGKQAIFTFQPYTFDNGTSYMNVKDILLLGTLDLKISEEGEK